MVDGARKVLIASVSQQEGRRLEALLAESGWSVVQVGDAEQAARELDGAEPPGVLVIDAGMIEMPHDAQWRALLVSCSRLGVIVRCLAPREAEPWAANRWMFRVHPDDVDSIHCALRRFGELRPRPAGEPVRDSPD